MAGGLKRKQWDETDDPVSMIEHLGRRGCTLGFTPLADVLLIRVWRRVRDETLRQVMYDWFGTGQTKLTQDEANAAAEDRINVLSKKLARLKPNSAEHIDIAQEIRFGKSLLVFNGAGFEETMIDLCQSMAAIAENPAKERKWQANTIRALFDFSYNPPED